MGQLSRCSFTRWSSEGNTAPRARPNKKRSKSMLVTVCLSKGVWSIWSALSDVTEGVYTVGVMSLVKCTRQTLSLLHTVHSMWTRTKKDHELTQKRHIKPIIYSFQSYSDIVKRSFRKDMWLQLSEGWGDTRGDVLLCGWLFFFSFTTDK